MSVAGGLMTRLRGSAAGHGLLGRQNLRSLTEMWESQSLFRGPLAYDKAWAMGFSDSWTLRRNWE